MKKTLEVRLPADLRKVLTASATAKSLWSGLTPIARRDFVTWIESAKLLETRKRRVESIPSRLASGKRRPCCYAIVPMNLYKALSESPAAKRVWSSLTPDERRDFVQWIDSAKQPQERSVRIATTCTRLAHRVRHP